MVEESKNLHKILIMAIINTTPDSFADGGKYLDTDKAVNYAQKLIDTNIDIIDIGGESSRPNANYVNTTEEINRVIPVIKILNKIKKNTKISIDTYKPKVMVQALENGVDIINDIFALRKKGAMEICSDNKADICLMHMQNNPQTMQNKPTYNNIIDDIKDFFSKRINNCIKAGINEKHLIIDPGFGFGKTLEHNLTILRNLSAFKEFGLKILVSLSRKSMFDKILGGRDVNDRIIASTIANKIAIDNGANIIRTHDVQATTDMLKIINKIYV